MIIPHALANRLNVFQEGRCLEASRASLVASRLFPSFAHSSRQICRSVTALPITYHTLVNPMDRLETVWKIMFLILGDHHTSYCGKSRDSGHA